MSVLKMSCHPPTVVPPSIQATEGLSVDDASKIDAAQSITNARLLGRNVVGVLDVDWLAVCHAWAGHRSTNTHLNDVFVVNEQSYNAQGSKRRCDS
jgi:hypothetical protein